ncbi:MAG: cob(I)yrinic acid a,c-diamide adenosyltransferase [Proteobacteria bacterium]|nr:cob(I)yrinic acid a,c-diamide adenosyltransferase [Pseudomonadota bacterium]MDE3207491.1 cob(I)yrinic acid a,c-diamide adenosyltransferase [Pseudomonadota bacterium]
MTRKKSRIYTKTGDQGTTGLANGQRIQKNSCRIMAQGALDELNSAIGCILAYSLPASIEHDLTFIQTALFELGALLSLSARPVPDANWLEHAIDRLDCKLPALRTFIMPGGGPAGAATHFARSVCRRAEVSLWQLNATEPVDPAFLVYLNRLSDYLFVAARMINHMDSLPEIPWNPES